MRYSQT